MDISKSIIRAFEKFQELPKNVDDVFALDIEVRNFVRQLS
jgi:1-deoxy-D-xylulose-5-phosphate reductoisomerase